MNDISEVFAKNGILYPAPKVNVETPTGMTTFTGQIRHKKDDGSYVIAQAVFHVKAETFAKVTDGFSLEFSEGCG